MVDYRQPADRTYREVTHSLAPSGTDAQTGRPPTNPTGQEPADGRDHHPSQSALKLLPDSLGGRRGDGG